MIQPDDDLIAYIDGEATATEVDRVLADPALRATADTYARTQRALQSRLYRFDCPTAQTLGDYEVGLLSPTERTRVAAHITGCPHCLPEVQMLRAFLADDPAPVTTPFARLRRVVADLLPDYPALAGVRGATTGGGQMYRSGTVTVALDAIMTRDRGTLTGLLWREEPDTEATTAPEPITAARISLFSGDVPVRTTTLDDLGNFTFDDLAPGSYTVEVTLDDDHITLEGVRVGT